MIGHLGQLSFLVLVAVLGAGCAPPRATWARDTTGAPAAATTAPKRPDAPGGSGPAAGEIVHVVQPGETLYRIARHYKVDPDELADANEITDPTKLAVGRELVVPTRESRQQAAAAPARSGTRSRVAPTVSGREPRTAGAKKRSDLVLRWPVEGVLYSRFGPRGATRHDGIDIAAPEGTPIVAAADGQVLYSGVQRGYGNLVILRHGGDLITIYAHNRENLVKEGDEVKAGQQIATVGRTGRASGPHCHFEVRRGTDPHDPLDFLP